jgi:F-type H+-transporting ATPase subunit beta
MANIGKVKQVIGPVVDVSFSDKNAQLPKILNALIIIRDNGTELVLECQQHLGENSVRAIAMDSTDGIRRGISVVDTGDTIKMPIGDQVKGRLFNVIGDTIDGMKGIG